MRRSLAGYLLAWLLTATAFERKFILVKIFSRNSLVLRAADMGGLGGWWGRKQTDTWPRGQCQQEYSKCTHPSFRPVVYMFGLRAKKCHTILIYCFAFVTEL